ncbi:MAG: hypothetical protein ACR5KV_06065 [Wolbachia sp.]
MKKYISNTSLPLQEEFMLSENEIPIQYLSRNICHVECDKGSLNIFASVAAKPTVIIIINILLHLIHKLVRN